MTAFDMGNYGIYVWSAYGITLLILAGNVLWSIKARRKIDQIMQEK